MHFVPRPEWHPGYCAVTGRSEDAEGFIDTGNTLNCIDPKILVSVEGVKTLARMIGWQPPEVVANLETRVAELEDEVQSAEHELIEAEAFRNAVHVLEKRDFKAKKRPGRPKGSTNKQKVAA